MLVNEDLFSLAELGVSFSAFDLTVESGEDVLGRITSAALTRPDQGLCVVIASGGASNITVKQPGDDATLNYQGVFQVLRLQGLYLPMVHGGPLIGQLKIVAGNTDPNDRQLIEGVVSDRLIAGFPGLRVSVGSFNVDFDILRRMSDLNRVFDVIPRIESPLMSAIGRPCPIRPIDHLPEGVFDKVRVNSLVSVVWLNGGRQLPPAFHSMHRGFHSMHPYYTQI